jgi:hypothetical protein
MTTTDNSPSLGGLADDLSPMISSVQTRVIADARGAYLAGNFKALIEMLNVEQRGAFRAALTGQAVWYMDRLVQAGYGEQQPLIADMRRWLTELNAASAAQYAMLTHIIVNTDTEHHLLRQLASHVERFLSCLVLLGDEVLTARFGGNIAAGVSDLAFFYRVGIWNRAQTHETALQAVSATRRWQADALWALLRGRSLPALDGFISGDAQGEYRTQNLPGLIARMIPPQRDQFKRAIVMQLAGSLPGRVVETDLVDDWRVLIDVLNAWNKSPSANMAEAVIRSAQQIIDTVTQGLWDSSRPVPTDPGRYQVMKIAQTVQRVMQGGDDLERSAKEVIDNLRDVLSEPGSQANPGWWQIEAAWAILHDDPIPPLEVS